MKKIAFALIASVILWSCNDSKKQENTEAQATQTNLDIIGRKATIQFPEIKAEVSYPNDSTLHWKTTDKNGTVAEGNEKMDYQKLTENLHFLNWIEKDGWTVSQIIDTQNGTVKAFWSFQDEAGSRGKRKSLFVDGKFEFVK